MSVPLPAPIAADGHSRRPAGRLLRALAIAVAVAAVVVAGVWGLTAPRGGEDGHVEVAAAVGAWVEADGGFFRVDAVGDRALAHEMVGMDPDPVPAGFRRLGIDVTLAGESSGGLAFGADRFTITGEGMTPLGPVRARLDEGVLAAGSRISGGLVFEVPEGASALQLRFEGGSGGVALPVGPSHRAGSAHEDE